MIGERVSASILGLWEDMEFAGNGFLASTLRMRCQHGNLENVLFYEIGKDGLSALKTSSVQFELKDDELAGNGGTFLVQIGNEGFGAEEMGRCSTVKGRGMFDDCGTAG